MPKKLVFLMFSLFLTGCSNTQQTKEATENVTQTTTSLSQITSSQTNSTESHPVENSVSTSKENPNDNIISQNSTATSNHSSETQASTLIPKATSTQDTKPIITEAKAIGLVSKKIGENPDYEYLMWSETPNEYVIKILSKSMQKNGGSGTVSFYTVNKIEGTVTEYPPS